MMNVIQVLGQQYQTINALNVKLSELNNNMIMKIGVQGPPGLKFILGTTETVEDDNTPSFKIGYTGIFTFDFTDLEQGIKGFSFVNTESNNTLYSNFNQEVIIDIFYK